MITMPAPTALQRVPEELAQEQLVSDVPAAEVEEEMVIATQAPEAEGQNNDDTPLESNVELDAMPTVVIGAIIYTINAN